MTATTRPARPWFERRANAGRLMVVSGIALAALAWAPGPVRLLALPFVLLAPGFALLTAAVGPARPASMPIRAGLWVALSLGSLVVGGMVAGAVGLDLPKWRIVLGQLAVIFGARVAFARWPTDPDVASDIGSDVGRDDDPARSMSLGGAGPPSRQRSLVPVVGLAVALVAGVALAGLASSVVAGNSEHPSFLVLRFADPVPDLAIVPPAAGEDEKVDVVVENHGPDDRHLIIVGGVDGAPAWPTQIVDVAAGETWTGTLSGPIPAAGCNQRLAVALVEDGTSEPVARLTRWVTATPGAPCDPSTTSTTTDPTVETVPG